MSVENVILIGMPGVGKSTVGVVLAKRMGFRFADSDLFIQEQEHRLLHEIITEEGVSGFLEIENSVNSSLTINNTVLATGGSVIYGRAAMEHLQTIGMVIYLQLSYEAIAERLGDLTQRGVAKQEHQSLLELYQERIPLYEAYAQRTIVCEEKSISQIVKEIATLCGKQ